MFRTTRDSWFIGVWWPRGRRDPRFPKVPRSNVHLIQLWLYRGPAWNGSCRLSLQLFGGAGYTNGRRWPDGRTLYLARRCKRFPLHQDQDSTPALQIGWTRNANLIPGPWGW